MNGEGRFIFIGTGGSMGIPVIGCHCDVCVSNDLHNKRFRASGLIKAENKKILLDCGPDFRMQALRYGIESLDGVLLTHAHFDHTAGLDDLRVLYMRAKKPLPCLLSADTAKEIKSRFYYMFREGGDYEKLLTKFDLEILPAFRGEIAFLGLPFRYMTFEQGGMRVNGFIIGNLAYLSDIKHYPETIFEDLDGIKTLVVSALRFAPSQLHLTVDEAIDFARKARARQTYLTHLAHELDHEKTSAYLPEDIHLAYDGLEIEFEYPLI